MDGTLEDMRVLAAVHDNDNAAAAQSEQTAERLIGDAAVHNTVEDLAVCLPSPERREKCLCMFTYILAFFTISPQGLRMMFTSMVDFLSGAIIPLPFMTYSLSHARTGKT